MYKGKEFSVELEDMVVNGSIMHVERVIPAADFTVMVAVLPNGKLILENIFRAVLKKRIFELPAGTMKKGEAPVKAAIRELEEETGWKAKKMRYLFSAYPSSGKLTYTAHFFLATDLKRGVMHRDEHEDIDVIEVTLKKALEMVKRNKIRDLKSIAGILYYARHFS